MLKNHNIEPSNNTESSNDVTEYECVTWPYHRMHDTNGNSAFCSDSLSLFKEH